MQYFFINCPQIKKISVFGCKSLMSKLKFKIIFLSRFKKKDDLIVMYILEGVNVQVDSETCEGRYDK